MAWRIPILDGADEVPAVHVNLDKTRDGVTRSAMTAAQKTKLDGVAHGATANAADTSLRDRATHTGTQAPSTIAASTATPGQVLTARDGATRWENPGLADFSVESRHISLDTRLAPVQLGEGDASSSTVLHGDGQWRQVTVPGGGGGAPVPFTLAAHPTDPYLGVLTLGVTSTPPDTLPTTPTPGAVGVTVSGSQVTLAATMTVASHVFAKLNIGVRRAVAGTWVASTPELTNVTVSGERQITGTLTLPAGDHEAYIAWSDDGTTWQVGPVTSFTVGAPTGGGGSGSWHTNAIGLYTKMWSSDIGTRHIPSQVDNIRLAFATGDPMSLVGYGPDGLTTLQSRIAGWRGQGKKIVLSLGGRDASPPLSNTTRQANAIKAISDTIGGLDGIDFDYESPSSLPSTQQHIDLSRACRAIFGSDFAITVVPGGGNTSTYYPIVQALNNAGLLTEVGHQHYDTADVSRGVIEWRVNQTKALGVPASKISIGMGINVGAGAWSQQKCIDDMTYFKNTTGVTKCYLWAENVTFPSVAATWASNMRTVLGSN